MERKSKNSKVNTVEKIITVPSNDKRKPKTKVTNIYNSKAKNFGMLGVEIKISPKSKVNVNEPGYKTEFFVPTVEVLIGIGRDNTATLIMSESAWEALKAGEKIDITTLKDFKKKFL